MSNIPEARRILQSALHCATPHEYIRDALKLLDRKRPDFVAKRSITPMSDDDKNSAVSMRAMGRPLNEIARLLGTNIGRVSEAINEVRV